MKALWPRIACAWCRAFHPEPMWPMHGHYQCPACGRVYPVPWEIANWAATHTSYNTTAFDGPCGVPGSRGGNRWPGKTYAMRSTS
jgi:hypothetical protein